MFSFLSTDNVASTCQKRYGTLISWESDSQGLYHVIKIFEYFECYTHIVCRAVACADQSYFTTQTGEQSEDRQFQGMYICCHSSFYEFELIIVSISDMQSPLL